MNQSCHLGAQQICDYAAQVSCDRRGVGGRYIEKLTFAQWGRGRENKSPHAIPEQPPII